MIHHFGQRGPTKAHEVDFSGESAAPLLCPIAQYGESCNLVIHPQEEEGSQLREKLLQHALRQCSVHTKLYAPVHTACVDTGGNTCSNIDFICTAGGYDFGATMPQGYSLL